MTAVINGLHHITAITGNAEQTRQFFSNVLGFRLVKQSINLDDPANYHFYFGDELGRAGSLLTFFPRENSPKGRIGAGQATIVQLSIPLGALPFWRRRLRSHNCLHILDETLFGDQRAVFQLPGGLLLALVESAKDQRLPWLTDTIDKDVAIRGLYGITLAQQSTAHLPDLLTQTLGFVEHDEERVGTALQRRFVLPHSDAGVIDLQIDPNMVRGSEGVGTIHHVALDVGTTEAQSQTRQTLIDAGMQPTEVFDRQYFSSVYARTAGGILLEIATTSEEGFTRDETADELGARLCLPADLEDRRSAIERDLPAISEA